MVQLKFKDVESKNLFSRHYLENRLKTLPIWSEDKDKAESVFREIKELYDREKSLLPLYEEAQLRKNFINPILRSLDHVYEVEQASDRSPLTPDYAFFSEDDSRRAALESKGKKEFYHTAIAIGDAKKWGKPLDKKSRGRARQAYDNPSYQIDAYLRDTDSRWGILTDGRFWRLYYRETSYRLDSYYEVDLASILEKGSKASLKYFYLFFRKEAFIRDDTGKNFLEKVFTEGVSYSKKIGEGLEKNVYKALKILGQGFLNWPGNNLTPTKETIKEIHENSLIFLYRLLFILYADSRGTLKDLQKPENKSYDINKIKAQAFYRKGKHALSKHFSEMWDRLTILFQLIDEGSEAREISKDELFVPPYNGGLFHSPEHLFLAEKKVGDKYVADVLELLTFSPDGDIAGFIDYSTLEIRHLGSIYEGLLEYKLHVADKNLVAIKQKGKGVWIPEENAEGKKVIDAVKAGDLYLVTDKGERKATGSYYTPDYIVKYIVENTLGPVVEEKLKGAADDEEKIERILSINVLDPAMGSGHFLVEATDFLAGKIVPFVKPEQLGDEKEINWARREVVKRCIYGVDLNPLATELAKLSLWLNTLEASRPLSFLDHHLKVGNSLIGADLQNLSKHPTEVKEATAPTFLSDFMDKDVQDKIEILVDMQGSIMRMAQGTIQDIKNVEALFKQFESNPSRQAFVELANLHTSYWLGNKFSKEEYYEALEAFRQFSKDRSKWENVKDKEYFKRTQEIAREKNFYHWKLEFPEVFFEPGKDEENPGFDAVIGNPPYGSIFSEDEKLYLKPHFPSVQQIFDSFATFIEKSINLLAKKKFIGFIVPSGWLTARMHMPLRTLVLQHCKIPYIIHLPYDVFPDAYIDTIILIAHRAETKDKVGHTNVMRFGIRENASVIASNKLDYERVDNSFWWEDEQNRFLTASPKILEIQRKMDKIKIDANNLLNVSRGITPFKEVIGETSQNTAKGFFGSIGRYGLEGTFKPVIYDDSLAEFKPEKFFKGPRLIIRRIISRQHRIHVTYVNEAFVINKSYLPALKSHHDYSLFYILALINSCLFSKNFIWSSEIAKRDDFPQLDIATVRELPIRRINFTTPKEERSKIVEELKTLYSEVNLDAILTKTEEFLPKDEEGNFITEKEKSDVVHDFLAFLAEQMIEMNKEKNGEVKGFLEWLEGYTMLKVDDMALKSKIREYYKHDWEEMRGILARNKKKIKECDVTRREPQEKIRQEYEASIAKLKPLLERIERTDRLIDQVVYRLYGLTEGEIKVVEDSV